MATTPSKMDHAADDLLRRAHPPEAAATIFKERVKQRPLHLRASSPDPKADARAKRQHERLKKQRAARKSKKPKPLSAKQKRALCIYEIPKEQQKYAIYQPLHEMWCAYMREVLGLAPQEGSGNSRAYVDGLSVGPFLASADYHGALVEVVRSRCVSRVGLRGIVVKDTKFTFEIITPDNALKTVPKEHTVFRFEVPFDDMQQASATAEGSQSLKERRPLIFDIYGNQFETRAADRANKKFRLHLDPEL